MRKMVTWKWWTRKEEKRNKLDEKIDTMEMMNWRGQQMVENNNIQVRKDERLKMHTKEDKKK